MPYAIGDAVVFADHGATVVHALRRRLIGGLRRDYVVLRFPFDQAHPDLVATVPVEGGLLAPLRDVAGPTEVGEALALLAVPGPHRESRYPDRRHRTYLIKLGGLDEEEDEDPTLDVREVAEVVRNLTHRDRREGLSGTEIHLLALARSVFVSELALARGLDAARATQIMDDALAGRRPPAPNRA